MLAKIFKYDFKATARLFIPMYLGLLVITLINKVCSELLLSQARDQATLLSVFASTFTVLYVVAIVASFILTITFVTIHFYKTMVSNQGYLTFTLPVKASTHLISKFLLSIFWLITTTLSTVLSLLIMLAGHLDFKSINLVIDAIKAAFIADELTQSLSAFLWIMLLLLIVSFVSFIMMVFTSIALGQQFRKNKIGGSVISYIGLYMINQMAGTIFVFVTGFFRINAFLTTNIDMMRMINNYLLVVISYYIVITIAYYFLSNYLFQNRLNLE